MTNPEEATRNIHAALLEMRDAGLFRASVQALGEEDLALKARGLLDALNVLCTELAERDIEAELVTAEVQRMGSEVGWTALSLKLRKVL